MKILIASDSYKGSYSSSDVSNAIEKGIHKVSKDIEVKKLIIADGGEGTISSLIQAKKGFLKEEKVLDPLSREIVAKYAILSDGEAVVEMAKASGLDLLSEEELNPFKTTTYGTGQLIKAAIQNGATKIYVGIGGSATNDCGVGMAKALGISFKDKYGEEIGLGAEELIKVDKIDISNINKKIKDVEIIVISDVDNPLCGNNGASYVYGPQKGANENDIKILDRNLFHLSEIIKRDLNIDIKNLKGSGAAGGLGGGLVAFCGGKIKPGIEVILDILNIDKILENIDLVITGEGRIDGQSTFGKVPVGVAKRAKQHDIPVIAIVGSIGEGVEEVYKYGIDFIVDIINEPMTLDYAKKNVGKLIEDSAFNIINFMSIIDKKYK